MNWKCWAVLDGADGFFNVAQELLFGFFWHFFNDIDEFIACSMTIVSGFNIFDRRSGTASVSISGNIPGVLFIVVLR